MPTLISSYARQLKIADIQSSRNLTIVQLTGTDPNFPELVPFNIAHQRKLIIIKEIVESGSVPEVTAENLCEKLILILEGEILIGSKQNRTINTSVLIPPKSKTVIPVSCVEQGRWTYTSKCFSPSIDFMSPDIRAGKVASVSENLKKSNKYYSNQHAVWQDVSFRLSSAKVHSISANFQDYVDAQREKIQEIFAAFKKNDDITGIVGFINGKMIGCDIIPQPEIFGQIFDRLVRSYSMDASYFKGEDIPNIDYNEQVEKLYSLLDNSKELKFSSPGAGDSFRIKGEQITGSALIYQLALIHLSVFSVNKNKNL